MPRCAAAAVVISVLLCLICLTKSSGHVDKTAVHWTRSIEVDQSLSSEGLLLVAESKRYTREDKDGGNSTNHAVTLWNCSRLYDASCGYNESSCRFVRDNCQIKAHLMNYLVFMLCDLPSKAKPVGYILLIIWCVYLISLLATTVDNFFVPPLIFLAEKLKLSPSIAGITLLALGNGAPDIFCVYSGLGQGDLALVLGSLAGGAMFITTVIMATVIIITKKGTSNVDKVDFIRDLVALGIVISAVVMVAFDGVVYLSEVLIFPLLYIGYIGILILISFLRTLWRKRQAKKGDEGVEEDSILKKGEESVSEMESEVSTSYTASLSLEQSLPLRMVSKSTEVLQRSTSERRPLAEVKEKPRVELPGLTWPAGHHIIVKIIWAVQWPFSLLRWLTIPPVCPSGVSWTKWHYAFAVISPTPMLMIILLAAKGWLGFVMMVGVIPLSVILIIIGILLSVLMAVLLRPNRPPHWGMLAVLVSLAFLISIVWLNLFANEVVGVLTALGLLLNIKTAILGLTVLALGNCVADWVADSVVAKSGNTQMAFASCFGSPMLSHVLGLSIAFAVRISMDNKGAPYVFDINTSQYSVVKVAWIFIAISLLVSIIMFPIFKFSPPKLYGISLICLYTLFVTIAVLCEFGIIPFLW